jgi:class 3 adenylate cyclase
LGTVGNDYGYDLLESQANFIEDYSGIKDYAPKYRLSDQMGSKYPTIRTYEGILKYFRSDYELALEKFEELEPRANEALGLSIYYERMFYHCLALIHIYETNPLEKYLTKINSFIQEFTVLAQLGKKYFLPRLNIMKIAFESIQEDSNYISIIDQFDTVIALCQKYHLLIPSGVASSILLKYSMKKQLPKVICQLFFDNTIAIFETVHAKTMILQLKRDFPSLSLKRTSSVTSLNSISISTSNVSESIAFSSSDSLDMMSLVKTSQALSVELTLSTLIKQVMKIILENVGAERGVLLMLDQKDLIVKAIADSSKVELFNDNILQKKEICCFTLIDIVKATKKEIILENASSSSYSQNSYILANKSKSIFVHPILKGTNLIGIIYLENNTIEGTFNINRKIVLGHISSQLAISYENATLYEEVRTLNKSYERFLPKEFLNQLGKGDVTKINKGDATTKKMSILFCDIRGFTNLTEKMNSEESFSFVNELLSYLAPIISKNNGFIDKFLGDCIMALFPYQVDDSVKCGLEMIESLENYNKTQRNGMLPVKMGIGVNYGDVMIGTLGAEDRLDGTVISDAVNTASRVESLTKTLGATFVVTKEVIDNLSNNKYPNRCIGKFLLKGKEIPMTLYQILDASQFKEVNDFHLGLMEFSSKNFSKAKRIFENISGNSSKYLQNVCELYEGYSFPDDWRGEIKIDKDGNAEKPENETLIQKKVKEMKKEDKSEILDILCSKNKDEILALIASKYSQEIENFISSKNK